MPRTQPGTLLAASRRGAGGPWRLRAVACVRTAEAARLSLDGAGRATVAWLSHTPGTPFTIRVARGAASGASWRISRDVLRVPENPRGPTVATPNLTLNAADNCSSAGGPPRTADSA
jgi:hypothetical protein